MQKIDYLTPEQHQAILYGPYFNGVDKPLKSTLEVKIDQAMARRNSQKYPLPVPDEPPLDYYQSLADQVADHDY